MCRVRQASSREGGSMSGYDQGDQQAGSARSAVLVEG